jgi:hypothetical protein
MLKAHFSEQPKTCFTILTNGAIALKNAHERILIFFGRLVLLESKYSIQMLNVVESVFLIATVETVGTRRVGIAPPARSSTPTPRPKQPFDYDKKASRI